MYTGRQFPPPLGRQKSAKTRGGNFRGTSRQIYRPWSRAKKRPKNDARIFWFPTSMQRNKNVPQEHTPMNSTFCPLSTPPIHTCFGRPFFHTSPKNIFYLICFLLLILVYLQPKPSLSRGGGIFGYFVKVSKPAKISQNEGGGIFEWGN